MSRYLAQADFGPANDKTPRWAVWEQYFIWAGNHGTRRVSGFYWTADEARAEMVRLDRIDRERGWVLLAALVLTVVVSFLLARAYL